MPEHEYRIRTVIAKPGLDGHDKGAKIVARSLKESGHIVFYTGIRQTPAQIADHVVEQQAEVLGLSMLSGAHLDLTERIMHELRIREIFPEKGDILVVVGGIIPNRDYERLFELGVSKIFGPGTSLAEINEFISANATPKKL
jgi:methylmalonyl-CoA mutase C-terminal domain/subunit